MSHTIQAVAWTLIHFCWQAAGIAAVYRAASLALGRRSSNARYLAALGSLLLMMAGSVVTFAWEMRSTAAPLSFGVVSTAPTTSGTAHNSYTISPIVTPIAAEGIEPASPAAALTPLLPWIDIFWLIGVVALSCRSIGGWWLIQRLRKNATTEAPAAAMAGLRRIAAALGLRKQVLLRVTGAIASPVTIGALRAMILLPLTAATSLSPEELEVVLAHELAHVRRADFFWNLVQTVIETLFFFHPAVWWIGARIRHERELCCDDLALKVCPDPLVYARALYRLEEQRSSQWQLAMALDGHQPARTLRNRIARILGEPLAHTATRGPVSIAAAGALLILLMLPVPQVMASLSSEQPAATASHSLEITPAAARPVVGMVHPAVAAATPRAATAPASLVLAMAEPVQEQEQSDSQSKPHKGDYIDQMKAAGYDVDLDQLVAMKIQGITPEYARSMAQLGFGKLNADQLIACKVQDVTVDYIAKMKAAGYNADLNKYIAMKVQDITPEYAEKMAQLGFGKLDANELISAKVQDLSADYIAKMKAAGYNADLNKYIAMKVQNITPEYAEKMAQLGFGKLDANELISAKVQDVTPEYIAQLKHDGLEVKSIQDAIQYRIFNVTPEFIAQMKAAGFGDIDHKQLMNLRVQGVTPEYAKAIRQQYPGATVDDIVKTKIFNINADFIADAKRHGFNDLTLEKLVKLRISGILDDDSDHK